jgi:adenylate cyclase
MRYRAASGGAGAVTACAACGTELREHAKFCDECGSPVGWHTLAEYKQVTVLFADVVRSMEMASTLDPERLREIMAELFDRSAAVVAHYGGTVDEFTGDGIMAVFGAPVSLEDHAFRACLAALEMQTTARHLATEVEQRDGVSLQLRIGLNSGQVIAGEIGSGAARHTTIGTHVGMGQRMESAAPPGGVMLSESTARLVDKNVVLGERKLVYVKNLDAPVEARRLLSIGDHQPRRRDESKLVGRTWELNTITGILDDAINGAGCVVGVVGPPGIGKSRLTREATSRAAARGVDVFATYCESHTSDVAFHVVSGLLRAMSAVTGLEPAAARARIRDRFTDSNPEDLLLFDDLLGIWDADSAVPEIAADARRRRLTAMVNADALARTDPAVLVIEDAHWIDESSESMLAALLPIIPQTRALVLITYRPEYQGALSRIPEGQTLALRPMSNEQCLELTAHLLGEDPSLDGLVAQVSARAGGNPFFVEEIIRDLAERSIVHGRPGSLQLRGDVGDVEVPATLQAAIGARIDRLSSIAKRTINAAAVVGVRFDADLLGVLVDDVDVLPLIDAQLIEQTRFAPRAEFAFRHPLIRSVAYGSQLKSERAPLHRRLAAALAQRETADETATLIAEHFEAAGDLPAAFGWHMRAATWSTWRNIAAARSSWNRAEQVADRLLDDEPDRLAMRIAPRTLLCANAYRFGVDGLEIDFDQLQTLCAAAGDERSLAIGTHGLLMARQLGGLGHDQETTRLASELTRLLDSLGDATLTVALSVPLMSINLEAGRLSTTLTMAQHVIDLADGDLAKGRMLTLSPLMTAIAYRGLSHCVMGLSGWKDDFARAIEAADAIEPAMRSGAFWIVRLVPIANGILLPDATAMRDTAEILTAAEQFGDNFVLTMARAARGITAVYRDGPEREAGRRLLEDLCEPDAQIRHFSSNSLVIRVHIAREKARVGDFDSAIELVRTALDGLFARDAAQWIAPATRVLVEALLRRGSTMDFREARTAIDRLAAFPTEPGFVLHDIWLLRLRALLAQAQGDDSYRGYRDRYRKTATDLGFEGHIAWAEAMP